MRVRTCGFAILAFGILIGAGGCSSESPTSPLAPSTTSEMKGGYIGGGQRGQDSASVSTQNGGYIGGGQKESTVTASGGYIGGGQ